VRRGPLELTVLNRTGKRLPSAAAFADVLAEGIRRNSPPKGRAFSLTLVVVGDEEMSELASRYAGARDATDVLAFGSDEAEHRGARVSLGDVVISRERAAEESAARGLPITCEMRLYALHGLLHLLGYDDSSAAGRRRMFAEQAAVVGAPGGDLS
jgi:probable rRNA maturation factor